MTKGDNAAASSQPIGESRVRDRRRNNNNNNNVKNSNNKYDNSLNSASYSSSSEELDRDEGLRKTEHRLR